MFTIRKFMGYTGGAALLALLMVGGVSAQSHTGGSRNVRDDDVTNTAPCGVANRSTIETHRGGKLNVGSGNGNGGKRTINGNSTNTLASPTFNLSCDTTNVTRVFPVSTRTVSVVSQTGKTTVAAEAPVGGAKAGPGATSGLVAMTGSLASLGYGVQRLLRVRRLA